jgi:hypothetical protein
LPDNTIGDWTVTDLIRFLQAYIRDDDTVRQNASTTDNFSVGTRLTISNEIQLMQNQTTVGAAGSGPALPATPETYARVIDANGSVRLVPLYRAT